MARVMVIDDDPNICKVVGQILIRHGHRVETFPDGVVALEAFEPGTWELVITDVFMPRMDGIQLIIALTELEPDLPIIVMSGGGFAPLDLVLTDAEVLGAASTLAKPFKVDQLMSAVEEALARPNRGGNGGLAAG